jgi:protein-tyrosine phosphatase
MDDSHVQSMIDMGADPDRVLLMMQFLEGKSDQNVPDPYYGGQEGFDHVFECIEEACQALLKKLSQ